MLPFTGEPSERSERVSCYHSLVNLANVANRYCATIHWWYTEHAPRFYIYSIKVFGEPSEPGEPRWRYSSSGHTSKMCKKFKLYLMHIIVANFEIGWNRWEWKYKVGMFIHFKKKLNTLWTLIWTWWTKSLQIINLQIVLKIHLLFNLSYVLGVIWIHNFLKIQGTSAFLKLTWLLYQLWTFWTLTLWTFQILGHTSVWCDIIEVR